MHKRQKSSSYPINKSLYIVHDKAGAVVVIAMIILAVLAILAAVIIRTVSTDAFIAINDRSSKQALYLAEAGLHHAMGRLNNDERSFLSETIGSSANLSGSLATGAYTVTVTRLTTPTSTFPTISMLRITSTGTAGRGERTIVAIVQETGDFPQLYDNGLVSLGDMTLEKTDNCI